MSSFRAALVSLLAFPLAWPVNAAAPAAPSVLAYYENDGGASSSALHARFGSFNQLASDSYNVTTRGFLTGHTFSADLKFARQNKIQTFATISNFGATDFSPSLAHAVIGSDAATRNFMAAVMVIMTAGHYQGVNVDFEGIAPKDRNLYTAFLRRVTARLHAYHMRVIVSVPAMLNGDPTDSWTGAFNLPAIGRFVDVVQFMTYDENGTWSDPGPVAGLDWVQTAVQYAVSVVPAKKLSLGLPAYGYDWDLTDPSANTQISWNAIPALLSQSGASPQWDAASSSPYFNYSAGGHDHIVWYENAESLSEKSALVHDNALAGISVFALGMEDEDFWQAVAL